VNVPADWQSYGSRDSDAATIAPKGGIAQKSNGQGQVGFGAILSYLPDDQISHDLRQDTNDLISHLHSQNPNLSVVGTAQRLTVDGNNALITRLVSDSPYGGQESDQLLTVATTQGLFYTVFITPEAQTQAAQPVFQELLRTLKFAR
jgi:hypothetical protein